MSDQTELRLAQKGAEMLRLELLHTFLMIFMINDKITEEALEGECPTFEYKKRFNLLLLFVFLACIIFILYAL